MKPQESRQLKKSKKKSEVKIDILNPFHTYIQFKGEDIKFHTHFPYKEEGMIVELVGGYCDTVDCEKDMIMLKNFVAKEIILHYNKGWAT